MTAHPTDSFIREIDEDLRREKFEHLWKRHGRKFLILAGTLIVLSATFTIWQDRRTTQLENATSALAGTIQQLKADNQAEVLTKLTDYAASAPTGQAALARLYAANTAADGNRADEAKTILQALGADNSVPTLYRDLARLQLVLLQLDTAEPAELQNQLSPLKAEGQPWRWTARELSALLSIKQGDMDSASAVLQGLQADTLAPTGVRERAGKLLTTLPPT